jgi:hypothetical protein
MQGKTTAAAAAVPASARWRTVRQVPARCVHMQTPREVAEHLNQFRQNISLGKHRRVPAVGYNMYL